MTTNDQPHVAAARSWATLLGSSPTVGSEDTGRELWPVTAEDGRDYFLKRLGPWRNLPVADEARILRWLAGSRIRVAEFMITDDASVFAGAPEDSYVLIPRLDSDPLEPPEVVAAETSVGRAIAELHTALERYPWPANSYVERLSAAVTGELLLPPDVAKEFAQYKDRLADGIDRLPVQLVHGDLTPDNVLLRHSGEVPGFIDFDHLPMAPRIWDVCRYLSRRMRTRWQGQRPEAVHRLADIEPLLRGYQSVTPLTTAELDVVPELVMSANIIEVSYGQQIASGLIERRMLPDHLDVLADTTETVRWQLDHMNDLRDAVAAVVG